ncbi:MAG: helix-turn-helix transcriptional regulator [Candidatus Limnocylindrales bacterium]
MPSRYRRIDEGHQHADRTLRRLGEEVRIARLTAGWSLRELARRSGYSRTHLNRIERGTASGVSLRSLEVVFATLGMELSSRPFPQGPPIRDAAHARLLSRFRARLAPNIKLRTEVPLRGDRERRAWDGELIAGRDTCKLEAETVLYDVQAQDRRIARKMSTDEVGRVVLLLADTRRNRRVLREFHPLISERYPLTTREIMAELAAGRLPPESGRVIL